MNFVNRISAPLRRYPEIIILTLAAFATRLWTLFTPSAVVFDEVYFKVFAGNYLQGTYYFDIHPPLGKLLLAAWAWLMHLNPAAVISTTDPTAIMRLLPAVAGALIIPVFYLFLRRLGASKRMATLGGALLLLDNALLVESRFILLDSLLILFGLSAVTLFLTARSHTGRRRLFLLLACAVLAGMSASIKWTGLSALGVIGIVWLYDQARHFQTIPWRTKIIEALIFALVPITIYMSSFWIHFSLLPKTGQGDAFMSPQFQSTLIGNSQYKETAKMGFFAKFLDLNHAMQQSGESLKTATHPYGSEWTTWPVMQRTVYFWQGDAQADGKQGNIYLLGNPVVWWGVLIIIVSGILASAGALSRVAKFRFALTFLGLGYAINYLPFAGIERVMFLYHYLMALIFSLAAAIILLGSLADWTTDGPHPWRFSSRSSKWLYFGVLAAAVIGFAYFAPLTYGWPVSPGVLQQHMWLPSWR